MKIAENTIHITKLILQELLPGIAGVGYGEDEKTWPHDNPLRWDEQRKEE